MEALVKLTPDEFVLIVKGQASEELQERFMRELEEPEGELRQMLREAQKWATMKFNPEAPPSEGSAHNEGVGKPIIRRAAFWDAHSGGADLPATGKDLTEYIRGTASPETIARVKRALEDPSSKVSQWLEDLANDEE
jgi:hypothetical protein